MPFRLDCIAIIGAGLGGCAIAIALSKQGVPVTVYEARTQDAQPIQSGVVVSPNGLRVLHHLGLYDRIKDKCYLTRTRCIINDKDETVSKATVADEKLYGYCNHRLWRSILLDEMKAMLAELGVEVLYESRFGSIVKEDDDGVVFTINGAQQHASFLIAADGIHSSVRRYVASGIEPWYTGVTAVITHVPRAEVAWPFEDYEPHATIQGKPSAIWYLPEDPNLKTIMVGIQINYPEQTRADIDRLQQDKDRQVAFFQKGYSEHGATAQSLIDAAVRHTATSYIWPFLKMPKMERWYSTGGRVALVGDAAHALPASSAQGVNQAFEDAYSLALLLSSQRNAETSSFLQALASWQSRREERVEAIFDWATNVTNISRLPEEERKKLEAAGKLPQRPAGDLGWQYAYDVREAFKDFLPATSDGSL